MSTGVSPNSPLARFGHWTWLLVGLALAGAWLLYARRGPSASLPAAEPRTVAARGDLAADERATIELFQRASASVVFITTLSVRRDALSLDLVEVPQGTGSGFLWDEAGHVVTNFHVLQNATAAQVTLTDHSSWPARVVGVEPDKDLAVLLIEAPRENLPPLAIGTSHDLQVGQRVFAIGNPFGLDHTLTTGIISGLDREVRSVTGRPIQGVIQTDAAINPGNSGGPLLDSAGRLIGVNSVIVSPSGAFAGIGFAVPVDTVNRIVPQLIRLGRVKRPGLGIRVASDRVASRLGVRGVLIVETLAGGPAAAAGLRPTEFDGQGQLRLGDLIVGVSGQAVEKSDDLYRVLDGLEVGDEISLELRRGERNESIKLRLAEL